MTTASATAPLPDLRLGDDCRLLAATGSLEPGDFVTVSGLPYSSDPSTWWTECEFGDAGAPQWDEFPVAQLKPLCAQCTADAATRTPGGELLCNGCADDREREEGWQHRDPL